TVDNALKGDGCLSVRNAWNVPDLLHRGEGLGRLVGSQPDHKVESSSYRCGGFYVGNALTLGYRACTFYFAFSECVSCLCVFFSLTPSCSLYTFTPDFRPPLSFLGYQGS